MDLDIRSANPARARWMVLAAAALVFLLAAQASAQSPPAQPPAGATTTPGQTPDPFAQPQPLEKVYVVGYVLVAMMIALGLLVICRAGRRQERPDLPQEELAERLRTMYAKKPKA